MSRKETGNHIDGNDSIKPRDAASGTALRVMDDDALLPPVEVARMLNVEEQTLRRWRMDDGRGPRFVKLGAGRRGRVAYRRSDIDAFVVTRLRSGTAAHDAALGT